MIAPEQTQGGIPVVTRDHWMHHFTRTWRQGEHAILIGETGVGKTTLARDMLRIRTYVVAVAVKPKDDVLDTFKRAGYRTITQWPPERGQQHVVAWFKPRKLADVSDQMARAYRLLDDIYQAGGWTVFLDDAGYVAAHMRMRGVLVIMLSQGRSAHLTIVTAVVQPSSVSAAIPSEAKRQVKYVIVFRYEDEAEIKAIASITGTDWRALQEHMELLGLHDFLVYERGRGWILVRQ